MNQPRIRIFLSNCHKTREIDADEFIPWRFLYVIKQDSDSCLLQFVSQSERHCAHAVVIYLEMKLGPVQCRLNTQSRSLQCQKFPWDLLTDRRGDLASQIFSP